MKKFVLLILFMFSTLSFSLSLPSKSLYESLGLKEKVSFEAFDRAFTGYSKIKNKKRTDMLVIIDFTKPSSENRFFVLDIKNKKILHESLVSHGKNSGKDIAVAFSDTPNSYQSSLGFYLTEDDYDGLYGYSLKLEGLEPGINSNAKERGIVVHGADYVTKDFIDKYGFLGRSLGCPALPADLAKKVIGRIKGGTVLYINGNDDKYLEKSKILAS